MFDRIIAFSIGNKIAVGISTLLLVLVGIYSVVHLPVDAQPDITNNQVQIITQAPSLGAQEVEQFITAPIELAMANIAGIIERRSISRSGISVITIVFKDNLDIYWARTQVNAQLKEAENGIPESLGQPMLAPITTGLGEIYQYVIHTTKGYETKYTATDLRTIQDWLVRTQLAGTAGVAEVSGWGGYVKQYEIALDNDKLNAFGLTIPEVFNAVQKNNENTGGSYIEQQNNAYFIRGLGQVKTLDDIRRISIRNIKGLPILIRDVATVQFGSATRYGAVTRNGEGEVVAGVTLMLKGENFSQVIENVKERFVQIGKSLPEGVVIEPFIDRTELVDRAIGTVKQNLLEGALIVVFVLVLLLGNLRAGLVVASVIPLAMLFAFSMMRLFGVWGNLMSLGAIDFGLIVDGAVIIVESVVHHITTGKYKEKGMEQLSRKQMDEEVKVSASKLMHSAAFGQIIILIVYLPLLSLVGIEGKMFRPMAETVAFAILGAFFLSLTYVPVVSALFLSKKTEHKRNISDRLMGLLQRAYQRLLIGVLKMRIITVVIVFGLFGLSIWALQKMGGEFIPTLDEGDLTVEISMMQGTSLTEVMRTFGKAEKLLKERFPEIRQAVTRIGSSEIPTDPMPIEKGDMMLSMTPKKEWHAAKTKDEMIEKMESALRSIPGIRAEISQPMQMRFNELMTGIRQDVAIKIFGDDLQILAAQAEKLEQLIAPVTGVSEPFIEKVSGLPQIQVTYNRDRMAQYGLNISDINMILKTAFAGSVAGVVFEGEKRFDMVVRLNRNLRENISGVENLLVPLASGNKVPLNQVADVAFRDAPAQISREDGKRRIYVGFNVSGRDVETTVREIQSKLNTGLQLPSGYYLTYGGQFQNFQAAKGRLSIAVPAALILILILLYITFRSVKESLLIFTAVPLASMGGVGALMLRGMPFSISAGVGFIALFGVAVLNGIVLIGYFNQLKEEGVENIYDRILQGTKTRLRPVLMTASVASLGFLPMALSSSAGAEVQRPLATVVIGGLVTATFLTLFVLPCLYLLVNSKSAKRFRLTKVPNAAVLIMFCVIAFHSSTRAQHTTSLTLDSAVARALRNNLQIRSANLSISQAMALEKSAIDIPKTELMATQDPTSGGNMDNAIGLTQTIAWPGLYRQERRLLKQQTAQAQRMHTVTSAEVVRQVRLTWYAYLLNRESEKLLSFQDSVYSGFLSRAETRFKTGETSKLELINARTLFQQILTMMTTLKTEMSNNKLVLRQLMNDNQEPNIAEESSSVLIEPGLDSLTVNNTPRVQAEQQAVVVARTRVVVEKAKGLPDFTLGYNHQLVVSGFNPANIKREYFPGTRVAGVQVGVAIPIFNAANRARVRSAEIATRQAEANADVLRSQLQLEYNQTMLQYEKYRQTLSFYTSGGLEQADEQMRLTQVSLNLGEIGYVEYVQNMTTAVQTKLSFLETVGRLNKSAIDLKYLKGE